METKKTISRLIANLDDQEKLNGIIKKALYEIAAVDFVTADHRKQFDELKSQIEAARQQLTGLNVQIDAGKAELQRLGNEKEALVTQNKALDAERREHVASLENLRQRFEAA